jgi:metalloendopeptidase OMA1, mitochondrial
MRYSGKLLPPTHVITRHVHRIISRILEANNLGTLRGDLQTPIRTGSMTQTGVGFGDSNSDVDEGSPDSWDPDAAGRSSASRTASKEWNLLVVNDEKVVNAMAAPGKPLIL